MKKLPAITFTLCALSVFSFAQASAKAGALLEGSMQKFRASIINKNPTVFLSFISKTKALTMMNTISQGEAGNEDKPIFVSTLKYAELAADFKKRGDNYKDFFTKWEKEGDRWVAVELGRPIS